MKENGLFIALIAAFFGSFGGVHGYGLMGI